MNIAVIGMGYVGVANAFVLAKKNKVTGIDIDLNKVNLINKGISPTEDNILANESKLLFHAEHADKVNYKNFDIALVCVPTDYSLKKNKFDLKHVNKVIADITKSNKKIIIVIRSTVPVGFTYKINQKYPNKILFCPEFSREGSSVYDILNCDRFIVGGDNKSAGFISSIYKEIPGINLKEIFIIGSSEAEAIKLFSNTFLAMRISFFNELDSYAIAKNLDPKLIIQGVSSDSRIGNYYNNPSFGYGGYCLPKDTKQLEANFDNTPQALISSIIKSNSIRKEFIASEILKTNPKVIGIYRLVMKKNSGNIRESAILDIMQIFIKNNIELIVFEPLLEEKNIKNYSLYTDKQKFFMDADIILTNRINEDFREFNKKIYSRDLFFDN